MEQIKLDSRVQAFADMSNISETLKQLIQQLDRCQKVCVSVSSDFKGLERFP